jgi:hypothetical protein
MPFDRLQMFCTLWTPEATQTNWPKQMKRISELDVVKKPRYRLVDIRSRRGNMCSFPTVRKGQEETAKTICSCNWSVDLFFYVTLSLSLSHITSIHLRSVSMDKEIINLTFVFCDFERRVIHSQHKKAHASAENMVCRNSWNLAAKHNSTGWSQIQPKSTTNETLFGLISPITFRCFMRGGGVIQTATQYKCNYVWFYTYNHIRLYRITLIVYIYANVLMYAIIYTYHHKHRDWLTHINVAYHALRNVVTRSVATIEEYNNMDCVRNTHTPQ